MQPQYAPRNSRASGTSAGLAAGHGGGFGFAGTIRELPSAYTYTYIYIYTCNNVILLDPGICGRFRNFRGSACPFSGVPTMIQF